MNLQAAKDPYVTVNPCRLCTPLGACLAIRGIRNSMPLIHGSQGCATYIRRFLISHFREPMDIASSNFSEDTAIFGGENNLFEAVNNVVKQYNPELIGITSSCLTEITGEDIEGILKGIRKKVDVNLFHVSTPSFRGSHAAGFHDTVTALVKMCCTERSEKSGVFIAPPIVSPADLRYLKNLCSLFGISPVILPDYSETLDGGVWDMYTPIPVGGTPLNEISMAASENSFFIEFGSTQEKSAGKYLHEKFGTVHCLLDTPIGIDATDRFCEALSKITLKAVPDEMINVRNRCIDAYVDAHKYVSGVRTVIYGDEDMVPSMAAYCCEIGLQPVLCASEGKIWSSIEQKLNAAQRENIRVCEDADFQTIENAIIDLKPDLMIGTGKGTHISIKYDIPLVRIGFPIHDRFGATRLLHTGYEGAMNILDTIVNTLLYRKQDMIPDGYSYL